MNTIVPFLCKYSNDTVMLTYGLGGGCIGYKSMEYTKEQRYKLYAYVYGSAIGLLIPPMIQAFAPKPPFNNIPTYALPFIATYYTLKHNSKKS
jgi:hypothetical protein